MRIDTGKKIAELRKGRGLTQEQLANDIGVSIPAVSKWETGATIPDIMMLCSLADYFNVSTDELLGRIKFTKKAIVLSDSKLVSEKIKEFTYDYGISVIDKVEDIKLLLEVLKNKSVDYVLVALTKIKLIEKERIDLDSSIKEIQPNVQVVISDAQNEQEVICGIEYFLKMFMK